MILCLKYFNTGKQFRPATLVLKNFVIQQRTMSDHLDRTAHNFRQPGVSEAVVRFISDISPTVKHLTLHIPALDFSFKAGQWVDFIIPSVPTVGGYSMSSAPSSLLTDRSLALAVKYSDYAPAHWVHKQCKVGDKVGIRVGGDQIIYDPQPGKPKPDLLLLAGGIGINPLMSIIQHVADLHDNGTCDQGKVQMLYSASSLKELIFKQSIEEICQRITDVNCRFLVTKEQLAEEDHSTTNAIIPHRIDRSILKDALDQLDKSRVQCYICGPPPMIASMETELQDLGVDKSRFNVEKWW